MQVENAFEVAQSPEAVWDLLMDVPRVVSCVPGATLLETLGEDHWKAELRVKLGPVSMAFDSDVRRQEADKPAGSVLLTVKAKEKSGRGGASAEVRSALAPIDAGTRVTVTTNVRLQGAVARVGRSDIVEDVSQQMVDAFADCLKGRLTGELGTSDAPAPVSALRVAFKVLWARVQRVLRLPRDRG